MEAIARASTSLDNPKEAIEELAAKLRPMENQSFSVLFISNNYNIDELAPSLRESFGKNVIGCTTAGEISDQGFSEKQISGICLHGESFLFEKKFIADLENIEREKLKSSIEQARNNEKKLGVQAKTFCVLLIDGLSVKEEVVTGMIGNALEEIPLVGGSAGDGLNFEHTYIYTEEKFTENSACLLFVTTTIPFEVFKIQHFEETETDIVITEAEPEKRIVNEIDGESAAQAYADILGIEVKDFSPMIFSKYPLMLKVGDELYVRSIQKVNEDGSLTFYCAIDNGLVLTLAKRKNLLEHTASFFDQIKKDHGEVSCSLLFECILRRLEIMDMSEDERQKVSELYSKNNAIGFHTYGEQWGTIHINQTLTGVVFGKK